MPCTLLPTPWRTPLRFYKRNRGQRLVPQRVVGVDCRQCLRPRPTISRGHERSASSAKMATVRWSDGRHDRARDQRTAERQVSRPCAARWTADQGAALRDAWRGDRDPGWALRDDRGGTVHPRGWHHQRAVGTHLASEIPRRQPHLPRRLPAVQDAHRDGGLCAEVDDRRRAQGLRRLVGRASQERRAVQAWQTEAAQAQLLNAQALLEACAATVRGRGDGRGHQGQPHARRPVQEDGRGPDVRSGSQGVAAQRT
jgi:hypothetical protein